MIDCPYCGGRAALLTGADVFPHLPKLREKKIYVCRPCDARVGCHPGTETPLGTLANRPLRQLRSRVHALFDPMWTKARKKHRARQEAYTWLAERLGIPVDDCHVGQFTEGQCRQALDVLRRPT